jgi:hypothetical protein
MRIGEGEAIRRYLTDDTITWLVDVLADGAGKASIESNRPGSARPTRARHKLTLVGMSVA